MVSGFVCRPDQPARDDAASPPPPQPGRQPGDFGLRSRYYQLYRQDPREARRALYRAYIETGRSIRGAAASLGCSRNTVRNLLKRRDKNGRILWRNRPFPAKKGRSPAA